MFKKNIDIRVVTLSKEGKNKKNMGYNNDLANKVEDTKNKVKVRNILNFDDNSFIKVSIIVPVCNVQDYLKQCIKSALNQTLKEIEIICVNDGSSDDSLSILIEYSKKDHRIKVIDKDNAGYGHTMNIGMDMARGEYIAILESDDYISPNMMHDLYNIAVENDLDIVRGDFFRFTTVNGFQRLFYNRLSDNNNIYNRVINISSEKGLFKFANTWSGIYRRTFIENNCIRHHESPGASYQDNGFWFISTVCAERVMYVDKPYYYNRRDNPNSSVFQKEKAYLINREYDYIANQLSEKNVVNNDKTMCYAYLFQKKFDAYKFNYGRIDKSLREKYIFDISKEFSNDLENRNLSYATMSSYDIERLMLLLKSPDIFYEETKDFENSTYTKKIGANVVHIAFICDDGYIIPTATAIRSLLRNKNTESFYDISILTSRISDENIRGLLYNNKPNVQMTLISVDDASEIFNSYKTTSYGVSNTALIKFLIPSILSDVDKVLYLDGDVSVMKDLSDLFNQDIGEDYAGVVRDMPQVLYSKQIFGLKYGKDYFNSGVLLLNLKKMRQDLFEQKLIEERQISTSTLMDQDVFNEVFNGKVKYLSIQNNTLYVNLIRSREKYTIDDINSINFTEYKSIEDIRLDSRIIHFCSEDKPWKFYDTPMADYWLFIYFTTELRGKIRRKSVNDKDVTNVINGDLQFEETENITPVIFFYKKDNIDEINSNIDILNRLSDLYRYYVFYDGKVSLDKGLLSDDIEFIDISRIIERDNIYLDYGQLEREYYKIVVPEIFPNYSQAIIIDGCVVTSNFSKTFISNLDKDKLIYSAKLLNKSIFFESPLVILNIEGFIKENLKFKFWDFYKKSRRLGLSFSQAIKNTQFCEISDKYYYIDEKENLEAFRYRIENLLARNLSIMQEQNKILIERDVQQRETISRLEMELYMTRTSFSCKLGLALTAIPRKIFRRNKDIK